MKKILNTITLTLLSKALNESETNLTRINRPKEMYTEEKDQNENSKNVSSQYPFELVLVKVRANVSLLFESK